MVWFWAGFFSAPFAVMVSFAYDYFVNGVTIGETFQSVLNDDEIDTKDVVIVMAVALVVPFLVWYLFMSSLINKKEQ